MVTGLDRLWKRGRVDLSWKRGTLRCAVKKTSPATCVLQHVNHLANVVKLTARKAVSSLFPVPARHTVLRRTCTFAHTLAFWQFAMHRVCACLLGFSVSYCRIPHRPSRFTDKQFAMCIHIQPCLATRGSVLLVQPGTGSTREASHEEQFLGVEQAGHSRLPF